MMAMAPLHHCARQLGEDPAPLFAAVAADLRGETAELVREFGARRDIDPPGWRFVLGQDAHGPFYRPMTSSEEAAQTERTLTRFLRRHPIWRRRYRRARRT